MIKILQFGHFSQDHNAGGIETYVQMLLNHAPLDSYSVNLVAHDGWQFESRETPLSRTIKVPRLMSLARTSICPTMGYWALKLHKIHAFDVVHLHFPDPMAHSAAYWLPSSIKKVITWHSDIINQKRLLPFYWPWLKHIVKKANAIITSTDLPLAFPQLNRLSVPSQRHSIPFGIDYKELYTYDREAAEHIKKVYAPKTIIFALGRHIYYKGFEYLIKAMSNLPNAVLLLGGIGPETPKLQTLINTLGLNAHIILLGFIPMSQRAQYYHAADIFCFPSIMPNETYGFVQLEAMACQKPIVNCQLNNGVNSIMPHEIAGLTVPTHDVESLSKALHLLINNPQLRQRLGYQGQRRVQKYFSATTMAEATYKLYQDLVS
jgi:glycosyltransferase involved in cell wall biosynthesis